MDREDIEDILKTFPVTAVEGISTLGLVLLAVVILLDPDGIWIIRGIDPDPAIENLSAVYGVVSFVAAFIPALGTGLYRSRSA